MNPLAKELNDIISREHPTIYDLLSQKGKKIFFPKKGILGQTAQAKGKKINATIGIATEDDHSPMRLKSIAERIDLPPQDIFPYAPSYGKKELREFWLQVLRKKNPVLTATVSLPVVTCALTHALSIAAYLFMDPGDKVILPDFFWGNYRLVFEHGYDGVLQTFPTFCDGKFNVAGLSEKLGGEGEKKIFLFNSPNNPTGYTPRDEEIHQIVEAIGNAATKGKKILVLIDDAYFGLVYQEGVYRQSLFGLLGQLHENVLAVKIDGATKEDYAWGLRVGFITYTAKGISKEVCTALEDKTAGAVRGNISNVSHLSQSLLLTALQSSEYAKQKEEKYKLLHSRYRLVVDTLNAHPEYREHFIALPFNSGYFMCVQLQKLEAEKVRTVLLERYDTGVIAIGSLLRIAFSSLSANMIAELFNNIYCACCEV